MPRAKRSEQRAELVGAAFGEWIVLRRILGATWLCRCSCGTEGFVQTNALRSGKSKSCGCKGKDWCRTHGLSESREYNVWSAMIQRCTNPNHKVYGDYGGRGITVCQQWKDSFAAFFADMGDKPKGRYSIGRIDNDRGYEPGNCRWETQVDQIRNRRVTPMLTIDGITKSAAEWAEERGLKFRRVQDRIRNGLTGEDALSPHRYGRWGKTHSVLK